MFDIHCHLNDEQYDGEVEQIINNFLSAGVEKVICASSDFETSKKAKRIASTHDCVYYTVGVHPDEAEKYNQAEIEELLKSKDKKLVAVGEIGLDYFEHELVEDLGNPIHKDREKQKQVFSSQIDLANKYSLPIVIHCRDAYGDTLQILKQNMPKFGFEFHCYSGSIEYAKELMKLGGKFSFTGNVTFKNAKNIQQVASSLPLDCVMFETDSPYLTPVPNRGKRNEPKNVVDVLKFAANLRGLSFEQLEEISTQNAKNFFKIDW